MHHLPEDSDEYTVHSWAERKLSELARVDPNLCLDLIMAILGRDKTDRVVANLAAGALEEMMSENGEKMFDRVAKLSTENADFKKLLGGVWQGDMSDTFWNRFQKLANKRW